MYQKEPGYFEVASMYGVPVFVHWSFPIGGLLVAGIFYSNFEKILFSTLAYLLLILIHEFGHFVVARYLELSVYALKVSGAGGMCYSEIPRTNREAFLLYSGGIIAHLIAFSFTAFYIFFFSYPSSGGAHAFLLTFMIGNLIMFIINLVPSKLIGGHLNDGYYLWHIVKSCYGKA